jgi:hypothetical protein
MNLEFKLSDIQPNVKKLTDRVLLYQMDLLNVHERKVTVLVLRHLREIECRRLFVDLGFSSMHVYCIKHLKYSESQTQRRLSSARLMTELPEIEKDIQAGSLNLTNLAKFQSFARAEKIASHPLNKEEKLEMLLQIQNKPTRQVERELIQKSHQPELLAEKYHNISMVIAEGGSVSQFAKFEALLSEENQGLLQEFKNLYAHELKDQANVSVLTFLLTKAVQHKKKQKALIVKPKNNATPPSAPKVSPLRTVVSASTRRFIWNRAGDCCEQALSAGKKCKSKYALEIDHIIGVALGGSNDIENLQLLCRAHNSRRAVKTFGVYRGG